MQTKNKLILTLITLLLVNSLKASILPESIPSTFPQSDDSGQHENVNDQQNDQSEDQNSTSQNSIKKSLDSMGNQLSQVQIDVIVIGSGIAGTAAAYELAENGKNVLILQANDYIGGRLKSTPVTLNDNSVFNFEEGANWIHGKSKKNPLTQLSAKIPNLKLIQTDDQKTVTYDESGKSVDKQVDKEWNEYEKIIQKIDQHENLSVYDAFKKINNSKVSNKYFMYHVANDIEFETSGQITDLSAEWGQDDQSFDGEDYLVVSRYQAFAEYLSEHQKIRVLLNHPVVEVTSTGENFSTVRCDNGEVFQTKKVIFAVPLGVLKKEAIRFNPPLPNWKNQAIQQLHMGNVCKILVIPKKNLQVTDKQQYIGVVSNDVNKRGAATYFLNIASLAKLPAYMTFGLGPNADELQNMPEVELKRLIARRFSVFAEDDVSSNDFDIVRSKWRDNQNFVGAYTYASVTSKPKHWQNMAKPIFSSGWYFCGEHTNSKYRGTVHGAYLSGRHTSDYILENLGQQKWKYADKS